MQLWSRSQLICKKRCRVCQESPLLPSNATASPKNQGSESNFCLFHSEREGRHEEREFVYRIRSVALLAVLVLVSPRSAQAGRLGLDLIALFPKDLGDFAYVNLQ